MDGGSVDLDVLAYSSLRELHHEHSSAGTSVEKVFAEQPHPPESHPLQVPFL